LTPKPSLARRSLFALSAGITAFLLTSLAAVAIYLAQPGATTGGTDNAASIDMATAPQTSDTQATDIALQLQALIDSREATYRLQLQQANQQLQQANARLEEAYGKLNDLASQTPPAGPTPPTEQPAPQPSEPAPAYAISPEGATAIALALAPGASLVRPPEPVDFQGTVAYEVQTNLGPAYVDANTGRVLYNGIAPTITSSNLDPSLDRVPREQENDEGTGDGGDD